MKVYSVGNQNKLIKRKSNLELAKTRAVEMEDRGRRELDLLGAIIVEKWRFQVKL